MGQLAHFLLIVFLHHIFVSSPLSINARHPCPTDQSTMLWKFKDSINTSSTASFMCEYNNVLSYPKIQSWNISTDCCFWDGVTCDRFSGDVIGVDLSCSQLQGALSSNSTLFQLSHLESLNLAYNDFASSLIPNNFSCLQSLTHLNLSNSGFSGSVPSELLHLFNLISLDLSTNLDITVEPRIFQLLLQNSTRLREVALSGAHIGSMLPLNISTSLRVLDLGITNLYGETPMEIFQLSNLQSLQLLQNPHLTGNLLKVKWNTSSALSYLDLSGTGFSGKIPESIGNLRSLYYLDLGFCHFSKSIPESLGNLTQMTHLRILSNHLTGQVPSSLANLEGLINLALSNNRLEGQLPNMFNNLQKLTSLLLNDNHFNGYFPSSIVNLTRLEYLYLENNLLTGPLPANISGLANLAVLELGQNSLNGSIPSWISKLPELSTLILKSNELTGQLYEFQYQSLQVIDIRGNKLQGPIPKSISKLVNLITLDLSYNNFSGDVEVNMFSNLKHLFDLSLSFNNLSLIDSQGNSSLPSSIITFYASSCGVKDLDFLVGAGHLDRLDLSNNMLHHTISGNQKLHSWSQNLNYLNLSFNFLTEINQLPSLKLELLDLRSNLLSGPLFIPPAGTIYFFASDNNFSGDIPSSICSLSWLKVLDLSNNSLSGMLPQCLGNMSRDLSVLDMHGNNLQGQIPSNFLVGSRLRRLNLRDNLLEGTIPVAISNCRKLEVVDIGNNHLNGTFPWLLTTLPKLQVASLRANHLQGPLTIPQKGLTFPALRILDLSRNEFTGFLPQEVFMGLKGMMKAAKIDRNFQFVLEMLDAYYKDSLVITLKGQEIDVVSVLSILTTIDLSRNKFEGSIPDALANLISIQGLNLSHNMLGGEIPTNLGNLICLESLDLSSNELQGEIPQQLTALMYLSVLNLSENHLAGRIPRSTQLDTFLNTSYLGNDGLCGPPFSKPCGATLTPAATGLDGEEENEHGDFISGFTWQAVVIGFGSGMVIGLSMGFLGFITAKPKWFNKIVEEESRKWIKKKWPKEVRWLSKSGN